MESTGLASILSLPSKVYDVLKFVITIALPAFGTAYWGLSDIWGLPNAEQVVATILVVETLLGVLLGISTNQYNKTVVKPFEEELEYAYENAPTYGGSLTVIDETTEDGEAFSFEFELDDDIDPVDIGEFNALVFEVQTK